MSNWPLQGGVVIKEVESKKGEEVPEGPSARPVQAYDFDWDTTSRLQRAGLVSWREMRRQRQFCSASGPRIARPSSLESESLMGQNETADAADAGRVETCSGGVR